MKLIGMKFTSLKSAGYDLVSSEENKPSSKMRLYEKDC